MPSRTYYVISVKHTRREDKFITIWGPNNAGYRQRLNTSGLYDEATIRASLGYYNTGCDSIAVPADVVLGLSTEADPKHFIGADPAPGAPRVLLNIRGNWNVLLANVIAPPAHKPEPQFPGARRRSS